MTVGEWVAGSCAAYAISSLGRHKDPVDAMKTFCRGQLGTGAPSRYGVKGFIQLAAHYIFIAGPEEAGKGHSKVWTAYGTEFAKYITDNQLGTITTLPAVTNFKHHPDTTCQVWLWQPHQTALEGWWKAQLEYDEKNPKPVSKYRASLLPTNSCPNCGYLLSQHQNFYCPHGRGEWPDQEDGV